MGTYYVRKTGNDSTGDGTTSTPWATLDKALTTVGIEGDHEILAGAGTYSENSSTLGYLRCNRKFEKPVTIRPENPLAAVIVKGSAGPYALRHLNACNYYWQGIEFQSFSTSDTALLLISESTADSSDITFDRCTFKAMHAFGSGDYMLNIAASSSGHFKRLVFENCVIDANGNDVRGMSANGVDGLLITRCKSTATGLCFSGGVRNRDVTITHSTFTASGALDAVSFSALTEVGTIRFDDNIVNHTGSTASTSAVVIQGGASGFESVVHASRNIITAPSVLGLRLHRYIQGGTVTENKVTAVNMAIAIRMDSGSAGGGVSGMHVLNNKCSDVTGTNGHALLFGTGSTRNFSRGNVCDARSGDFALVDKGSFNVHEESTFYGGSRNAVYMKGAVGSTVRRCLIRQDVAGGNAIEVGANDDPTAASKVSIVDNDVVATAGNLMLWAASSGDSGGSVCNRNRYTVGSGASWGSVRGSSVSSFSALRAAWSGYDMAGNDGYSEPLPPYFNELLSQRIKNNFATMFDNGAAASTLTMDQLAAIHARLPAGGKIIAAAGTENVDLDDLTVAGQPRVNRKPGTGFIFPVSRRADGTHKCVRPCRLQPGPVNNLAIAIDLSPLFGPDLYVKTAGTPTISGGSITAEALGPRDTYAMFELDGTATAGEERTLTANVTMDTLEVVKVVLDIKVFDE